MLIEMIAIVLNGWNLEPKNKQENWDHVYEDFFAQELHGQQEHNCESYYNPVDDPQSSNDAEVVSHEAQEEKADTVGKCHSGDVEEKVTLEVLRIKLHEVANESRGAPQDRYSDEVAAVLLVLA